uniref:BEAN1 protein n=1 Tax=Junco hyemalis TaxID=40217 RepID=A0A8C5J414_JUNHY
MGKGSSRGNVRAEPVWDGERQGLELNRAEGKQGLGRAGAGWGQAEPEPSWGKARAEPSPGKEGTKLGKIVSYAGVKVIFFHLPFISGSSISIGIGSNYSNLPIASNQSSASSAFPSAGEHGGDSSLLVSPLLVAGVVIGLVLLLSCATIVVGSLRRDSRARRARPGTAAADAPDGFSHGGSSAELRSTCSEELPPGCDFDSYLDILSQVNIMYPDPPPW